MIISANRYLQLSSTIVTLPIDPCRSLSVYVVMERFVPRDYELLTFLFRFVIGKPVHNPRLIRDRDDIYGEKQPWKLLSSDEKLHYFITQVKRKSWQSFGRRRQGNWRCQDKDKPVLVKGGAVLLGYKRSFIYKNKNKRDSNQDGPQLLLKEFYLSEAVMKKAAEKYPILEERKDFVLCRIKRKKKKRAGHDQERSDGVPVETIEKLLQFLEGDSMVEAPLPRDEIGSGDKLAPLQPPPIPDDMNLDDVPKETFPEPDALQSRMENLLLID